MDCENPPDCTPAGPTHISSTPLSHGALTILLVEDEAFVRKVACEVLCSAGYRVLPAKNAADAVWTFRGHAHEVRLLLTDLVLPDRSGCDLALELASVSAGVKAVFISGYPENCITRQGLKYPWWFYLPKPFSAASLLQKIKEVVNPPSE